jgi:hypothetical protein
MERQTVIGNQKSSVRQRSVQRNTAGASRTGLVGLQSAIGNQARRRLIDSPFIQAKLEVSQPGDPFEQEADRVADTVMRMPEQEVSPQPQSVTGQITRMVQRRVPVAVREDDDDEEKVAPKSDDGKTACCDTPVLRRASDEEPEEQVEAPPIQRQTEEEEEEEAVQAKLWSVQRACKDCEDEMVHRDHSGEHSSANSASLASNVHALNGRGTPLPPGTRAFFEPRFGADFSNVRIHTDSHAADTAKSINARAFTVGPNIAFGSGQFDPGSQQGKQILAHELTHVVQQGAATSTHQIQRTPEMIQTIPIAGVIPPVTPKQRRHFDHAEDVVDIKNKGTFKPGDGLGNYIASLWENHQTDAPVNIKFGSLGSGYIFVNISGIFLSEECLNLPLGLFGPSIRICEDIPPESQNYNAELQTIPLEIGALNSDKGSLVLQVGITNGFIHGNLGWIEGKKPGEIHPLSGQESPVLTDEAAFLPLIYGSQYDGKNYTSANFSNELKSGMILFLSIGQLELANQQFLEGKFGLINEIDVWLGELKGKAKGLEEYKMPIERSAAADLFGETLELNLDKEWTGGDPNSEDGQYTIQGKLRASFRNGTFDFFGTASYKAKRIQGEVNIAITTESKAKQLFAEHAPAEKKKGAPEPVELTPEEGAKEPLALTGWGNLHFKLIDRDTPKPTTGGTPPAGKKIMPEDLEGDGAFVVSSDGYIILSGTLKLPAQWQFTGTHKYSSADPEADKHLFEYSGDVMKFPVPPWGSVNLEVGITVDAEAQLDPLELYEIEISGVYSNHPDYRSEVGLTPHFYISGFAQAVATISAAATAKVAGVLKVGEVKGTLTATGRADAYIDAAPTISTIWNDKDGPASYAIAGKIYTAGKLTLTVTGDISVEVLNKKLARTENIKIGSWTLGDFGLQVNLNEYVIGSGAKPTFDYSKIGFGAKERKRMETAVVNEKEGPAGPEGRRGGFEQIEEGKEVEKGTFSEKEPTRKDFGGEAVDNVIEEDVVMQDQLHELSVTFGGTRDKPTALLEMASDKELLDNKIEREKAKVEVVKDFSFDDDGKEQLEQREKDINAIDREAETVTKNAQQTAQKLPEGQEPVVAGFDRLDDRIASYAKKHDVNDLGEIGPTKKPTIDKSSEARLELARSTFKDEHWVRKQLQDLLTVKETVAKELIREWRQAGKLFALESHLKDPFKAYNFDQTRAGERPLKDTESNRSKYGFKNPDHDSKAGQAILKKGWRPESPPTTDIKSRYDSMRGGKRAKPPSPYVDFDRTFARLGHGPVGASEYWNDIGHTKSFDDNRKWNLNPDHYWGPEHKEESDASGGSSPRYKVPMRAIGSHEDWL